MICKAIHQRPFGLRTLIRRTVGPSWRIPIWDCTLLSIDAKEDSCGRSTMGGSSGEASTEGFRRDHSVGSLPDKVQTSGSRPEEEIRGSCPTDVLASQAGPLSGLLGPRDAAFRTVTRSCQARTIPAGGVHP